MKGVALSGDVELTKDKAGLALARQLQAVVDATVKTLEADKTLPDAVQVVKPRGGRWGIRSLETRRMYAPRAA